MFFLKFLSSILLGTVETSISLNLTKIILKFGFVWITCSRSLEIGLMSLTRLDGLFWRSSSQVRKASFKFFNSNLG